LLKEDIQAKMQTDVEELQQRTRTQTKGHKINKLDKEDLVLMKSHGVKTENDDTELSQKCLKVKGIDNGLNLSKPEIKTRVHYGFLGKRHKSRMEFYQKRWFFIVSSRPLKDIDYATDDLLVEEKILPSFLQFDYLYYYEFNDDNDTSEAKGKIDIHECHEISKEDVDHKFNIIIDLGDRKFVMQSDLKGERDTWFEVLVNSRKTVKDIKLSITKKPRNLNKLQNIINTEGLGKLRDICETEKEKCIYNKEM